MIAIMIQDNSEEESDGNIFGLCIIEEVRQTDTELVNIGWYWVMLRDKNQWFPHGKFNTLEKAKKRMILLENGELEF